MLVLGIETSCDETAAALLEIKRGSMKVLSNIVSSQIRIHKKYGGVVPEVAARKHTEVIYGVISKALGKKKIEEIDLAAVTYGPGLVTSLRVGVLASQSIAELSNIPLVGVNHIKAHLLSPFLSNKNIKFPALGLIVSGGHTELVLMKEFGKYKMIGSTRDDAVGEAFDKVAKMLGLGYPGGPAVSKLAEQALKQNFQFPISNFQSNPKFQVPNSKIIKLPRPMIHANNFDFSFSGLKTAVLYLVKGLSKSELKKFTPTICREFQDAAIDVIVHKTKKAAEKYKVKSILVGGGVSANKELRKALDNLDYKVYLPDLKYTGDNAVMIAFAGYKKWQKTKKNEVLKINADPNLGI